MIGDKVSDVNLTFKNRTVSLLLTIKAKIRTIMLKKLNVQEIYIDDQKYTF